MKARNLLRQQGLTLIELIGAMAIGSVMLIGLVTMIDNSLEDMKGQQAAMYQAQLTTAVGKYITANYKDLLSTLPAGGAAKAYDIATLSTNNVLPSGFSDTNAYRQQGCALIRQSVAGQLDAFVVTTGGMPIPDKNIPAVAANAGSGSGYILSADTANVTGASWKLATTNFRNVICAGGTALTGGAADGGHLVSRVFQNGGPMADFLYRDDIGIPELNTMNTPIRMANNAVVVAGDACTGAAIAVDANNYIMRCSSTGIWTSISTWKEPVDTYALLPATDQDGDVRMTLDYGKAFMKKGGTWIALAEDQNGNLNVRNNLGAAGALAVAGGAAIGGHTEITNSLHTTQHISTDADVNAKGSLYADGNAIINGYVKVGDTTAIDARIPGGAQPGDVWAGRDVQAIEEARSGWLIVDKSARLESVFMNYNTDPGYLPGGLWVGTPCNVPNTDRFGQPYTTWPIGTIRAEGSNGLNLATGTPGAGTGKLMFCNASSVWQYVSP